ncbi:MAG: phosphoribosylamine--glycine ligase [Christensenellaceae bacterium]|nr:phosphoribosylamine--glycine ligase [Christensenellaceae bacterium]
MNKQALDIMVIGGGGREHAIIRTLKKSPMARKIYALPGNGGISLDAECVNISATDLEGIVEFAKNNKIDFAAVIPDDPLAMGLTDMLREIGIPCFGPTKDAAIIESSKAFAKQLMQKYGIPTADYRVFTDPDEAIAYIGGHSLPVVIKADGLALGKGVLICQTHEEAEEAIIDMMRGGKFGKSGSTIVIEEYLTGPEVSVLAFTDGKTIVPLPSSMDHKRALDGDMGLNTGGMGAVAPNPYYTDEAMAQATERIIRPTIESMNKEGRTFKGCLYFGLMLTKDGPKVIEYNCRFGDPETQAVLPLLESDLLEIMLAVENGTLEETEVKISDKHSCCLVLASGGYPEKYEKGKQIIIDDFPADVGIFHAGTKLENERFYTSGGRVLGITAVRESLKEAVGAAYEAAKHIEFEKMYMRHDIGKRALETCDKQ